MSEVIIVKESPDYIIQVGVSQEGEYRTYQLLNKQYNVIEAETQLLPQAYKYIEEIQAAVDAFRDMADDKKLSEVLKFPH